GYADIPGTLIFKAQNCFIKDRVEGGPVFRPQTRFADLMIHQFIDRQRKKQRFIGHILKPRGIGLSTDFGCLANYFPVVQPGVNVAITSKN
ncbi:hypothetical protein LAJ55_13755, partial [Streptococcus pneumoniae]|uniref:hypothetical protein n=1 Tax=Streptococcus pneumoniae TaxID=1313 RepID=UPI001CBDA462